MYECGRCTNKDGASPAARIAYTENRKPASANGSQRWSVVARLSRPQRRTRPCRTSTFAVQRGRARRFRPATAPVTWMRSPRESVPKSHPGGASATLLRALAGTSRIAFEDDFERRLRARMEPERRLPGRAQTGSRIDAATCRTRRRGDPDFDVIHTPIAALARSRSVALRGATVGPDRAARAPRRRRRAPPSHPHDAHLGSRVRAPSARVGWPRRRFSASSKTSVQPSARCPQPCGVSISLYTVEGVYMERRGRRYRALEPSPPASGRRRRSNPTLGLFTRTRSERAAASAPTRKAVDGTRTIAVVHTPERAGRRCATVRGEASPVRLPTSSLRRLGLISLLLPLVVSACGSSGSVQPCVGSGGPRSTSLRS